MGVEEDNPLKPEEMEQRQQFLASVYGSAAPQEEFRVPNVMAVASYFSNQRAFGMLIFTNKAVAFVNQAAFRLPRTLGGGMILDTLNGVADQELDAEIAMLQFSKQTQDTPLITLLMTAPDVLLLPRDQIAGASWPWWHDRVLRLRTRDRRKIDFHLNRVKKDVSAPWIEKIQAYLCKGSQ